MRPLQTIRIFSWNINGIDPFLPTQSTKITSFFQPSNPSQQPTPPKSPSIRAFLARHGFPEVLFLQELKIQPSNPKPIAALLTSLNTPLNPSDDALSPSRTYTLHTSLPRDKYNARGFGGKLYGVGTILRADVAQSLVARVRDVPWDLEGRVSVVELHSLSPLPTTTPPSPSPQPNSLAKPLALLNIYAVNGTAAPYRCPTTGRPHGTRHDHKLAFHARLRDECLALEAIGFRVVVAGDLNVARGALDGWPGLRTWPRQHCVNRADFNGKFFGRGENERGAAWVGGGDGGKEGGEGGEGGGEGEGGGDGDGDAGTRDGGKGEKERWWDGVDVWRAMYGRERKYTYFPRGREWGTSCDRVDMVIVSRALWEEGRVVGTGILDTPQERGVSDHVPLWVEVRVDGEGRREGNGGKESGDGSH